MTSLFETSLMKYLKKNSIVTYAHRYWIDWKQGNTGAALDEVCKPEKR